MITPRCLHHLRICNTLHTQVLLQMEAYPSQPVLENCVWEAKLLVWLFSSSIQLQAGWLQFQVFTLKVFPPGGGRASVSFPPASLGAIWEAQRNRREDFSVLTPSLGRSWFGALCSLKWPELTLDFAAVVVRKLKSSCGLLAGCKSRASCFGEAAGQTRMVSEGKGLQRGWDGWVSRAVLT